MGRADEPGVQRSVRGSESWFAARKFAPLGTALICTCRSRSVDLEPT